MSDIMNQLLTEAPITWEEGVKVQLLQSEIKNPWVQIIRFANALGDIVTGNFIPSQWESISKLWVQTMATLRWCDFMENIQDVTLEWIKGILYLNQREAYNLKTWDTFRAHITWKTVYTEKSMNIRVIIMLPKWEKCLEGTFIVNEDLAHNPFQSLNSSKFTIIWKQHNLSYKSTLAWRDWFWNDLDIKGDFKLDNLNNK